MFKFTKDLIAGSATLIAWSAALVVGLEIGSAVVNRINDKKRQKEETPEIDEIQ